MLPAAAICFGDYLNSNLILKMEKRTVELVFFATLFVLLGVCTSAAKPNRKNEWNQPQDQELLSKRKTPGREGDTGLDHQQDQIEDEDGGSMFTPSEDYEGIFTTLSASLDPSRPTATDGGHNDTSTVDSMAKDNVTESSVTRIHNPLFPVTDSSYSAYGILVLALGVFAVGVVGNLAVMCIVWNNYFMRSAWNYLLASLAFWDFLVLCFCLPVVVFNELTNKRLLGDFSCRVVPYVEVGLRQEILLTNRNHTKFVRIHNVTWDGRKRSRFLFQVFNLVKQEQLSSLERNIQLRGLQILMVSTTC